MNRRRLLAAGPAAALLAARAFAQSPATGAGLPATDEGRMDELVQANHILVDQGVLDGFGHVSVRSAKTPGHYLMALQVPALAARDDIVEFDENSQAVNARGREPFGERFIHGEIYRARPDVMAVVHAHTPEVIPFSITKAPLKAAIHVAYFLGTEPAPVFDLASLGEDNRMLVNNAKSGAALAKTLGARSVVLMRGHGMAVAAPSLRDAVFRAIYTKMNAQVEAEALRMGDPVFMNRFEVTRTEPVSRQWDLWVAHAAKR
jgi:HCOMODA/2-hydroxy-3-carboxy-muconic semialdehyde decarboxylase